VDIQYIDSKFPRNEDLCAPCYASVLQKTSIRKKRGGEEGGLRKEKEGGGISACLPAARQNEDLWDDSENYNCYGKD